MTQSATNLCNKQATFCFSATFWPPRFEQKLAAATHETSSVGARPSSAAPAEQKHFHVAAARSSVVRSKLCLRSFVFFLLSGFCWTGAAEDGRAPTEELVCFLLNGFCWTGRCVLVASFSRQDLNASTHCRGWDFRFLCKADVSW